MEWWDFESPAWLKKLLTPWKKQYFFIILDINFTKRIDLLLRCNCLTSPLGFAHTDPLKIKNVGKTYPQKFLANFSVAWIFEL